MAVYSKNFAADTDTTATPVLIFTAGSALDPEGRTINSIHFYNAGAEDQTCAVLHTDVSAAPDKQITVWSKTIKPAESAHCHNLTVESQDLLHYSLTSDASTHIHIQWTAPSSTSEGSPTEKRVENFSNNDDTQLDLHVVPGTDCANGRVIESLDVYNNGDTTETVQLRFYDSDEDIESIFQSFDLAPKTASWAGYACHRRIGCNLFMEENDELRMNQTANTDEEIQVSVRWKDSP